MSGPGTVLAEMIAWRSEPWPLSAVFVTTKLAAERVWQNAKPSKANRVLTGKMVLGCMVGCCVNVLPPLAWRIAVRSVFVGRPFYIICGANQAIEDLRSGGPVGCRGLAVSPELIECKITDASRVST